MIPIVNNDDCWMAYGGIITGNMICAGLLNVGGKSSCQVRHKSYFLYRIALFTIQFFKTALH